MLNNRVWVGVGGGLVALVTGLVLFVMPANPAQGPGAPYDHEALSEVSAATEQIVDGEASTVTNGLRTHGYWCVQPRGNDASVQVTCQAPDEDVSVDLIAARNGEVLYADIDLGFALTAPTSSSDPASRLWSVLNASLLKLWPQERATIAELLKDAQPDEFMAFGDPAPPSDEEDQYITHEVRTDDASWSLKTFYTGTPLALRLRTAGLQDHSWPYDGRHYATTFATGTAALKTNGFTCATSCSRATDSQTVAFDTHNGQIITARFSLRTESDDDPADDRSGRWVREGLPFLTPAVRDAVGRRIEQSRIARESWQGVVAGTPIQLIAKTGASSTPNGKTASNLTVVVGIPLLNVD